MVKYVDVNALVIAYSGHTLDDDFTAGVNFVLDKLESMPAANVRPVVRGEWVWDPDGMDWGLGAWRCGMCGVKAETWWANDRRYNPLRCSGGRFCGNCGADMRKEKI